jgi:type I restriction enzyme S subunit
MSDYPVARIGEIAASISDTHKLGKPELIFLNTSDILHGKFLHHTYSPVKDWPGQAKKSIRQNDILFSEIRPANGRWAYVGQNADDFVVSTKLMVIRANSDRVYPRFLYQFLTSTEITKWLQHLAESRSGTFPQITFDQVADLEIPLPPLPEQIAIAAVLGALDDKIELNRRMNATLEAMARALFQSWFVDFDPVRAKLDGRQFPNLDPATAALFPDSFQDSELGHIPKGWTVEPVGEVVDCVGGGTPSTAEPKYWEGGTHHWTTPKDFSSLQAPILLDTDRKLTDAGIAKISSGLLPAGTLLLSSRAPVGYLAIAAMPVAINQGFIALKCNDRATNFFMLNWCQTNMAEIEGRATGTTFAEISKQNFRPIPVVLPPKELMAAFTAKVSTLYTQITANLQQSRALAALRDTLLPKLLSGELSPSNLNHQEAQK